MRYSDVPTIREMLYQQFNARICLVDIYNIYKLAEKKAYANTVDDLLLPCVENRDEVRAFPILNVTYYLNKCFLRR